MTGGDIYPLFPYCIQNDVMSQRLSLSIEFKKPRPILLNIGHLFCYSDVELNSRPFNGGTFFDHSITIHIPTIQLM